MNELLVELNRQGRDVNAKYIVITDKKIKEENSGRHYIYLTAEALDECVLSDQMDEKIAPFNKMGKLQNELTSSFEIEPIVIEIENEKSFEQPELGDNFTVSVNEGIYGIPLQSRINEVKERFGTPSFEMMLADDSTLLSYGRNHWLTFQNGKLKKVEYPNTQVSNTLKNYIPFDDRFTDRRWKISESLYKNTLLEIHDEDKNQLHYKGEKGALTIHTTTYLRNNQKYSQSQVTGFSLFSTDYSPSKVGRSDETNNTKILASIFNLVTSLDEPQSLGLSQFDFDPLAQMSKYKEEQVYLLSPLILVESVGEYIKKIVVDPGLSKSAESSGWEMGPFASGQSEEEVNTIVENRGFFFDDILEIDNGKYMLKLFFEEVDGLNKLYKLEISIF
ncbi:hypothetical protein [Alteromonas sp. ASW11-130]|uniref:hypothetical protein n=1 Tax=Alteromonas sp. ASW11-130 TaxID=3015775 RepID=UPI0022427C1B|nr:hypothetical protein [Alteromonas sp. ASW11-130]MCW8091529.1 hypothetical protein [Alteromonas sp. ASW11-130]